MRRSAFLASVWVVGLAALGGSVHAAKPAHINGTPGDDVLVGTDADERLNGQTGNDSIDGGAGSDEVQAASGDDTGIYGFRENEGASDDYKGGSGFDRLVILIPDDVTAAVEVPLLQAAVAAFNAFLAATTGEGPRFFFAPFGFDLTVRGFEDLETNLVAVDDNYVTDEDSMLSVPAPGVLGNDINLDADPLSVTAVDGGAANVSSQIALASGALLTVGGDGSFDYDPNGQFEALGMGDLDSDEFDYTATDGTFESSALVTLTIVGVNDPPVADDAAFSVDENVANGAMVGTVTTSDPDAGDTLSFAITGGNAAGAFAIQPAGGLITVNDPPGLDFETLGAYNLTVTVTDSFGAFDTAAVAITVNDVNEAPTANDAAFAVDENVANGTVVGTVTASDPDVGDSLSFAITGGNVGGAFAIGAGSGTITVNNPPGLDFETLSNYSLTVTVSDSGGLTDTAAVTITVNDLPEGVGPLPDCQLTGAPAPYFCDLAQPAGTLGAAMVAATGTPIPGRTCNTDGLCTTDAQYLPAASSLTVNADGSFSLHYETNQCPLFPAGALILEFEITVGGGAPFVVDLSAKAANNGCN